MDEREELKMTEIETAEKRAKKPKRKGLIALWRQKERDFLDYLIVEVGVATAVLAVMLAVNVIQNAELADVFSRFSAALSTMTL